MPFPNKEALAALRSEKAPLEKLAALDADGLLLGPDETLDSYCERLEKLSLFLSQLDELAGAEGGYSPFPGISLSSKARIPESVLQEAAAETDRLYGFKIDWEPGFFLSKGVGPLWGGCAISFQGGELSVFIIRESFATRKRWFIYDRDELLAHELCHVARSPLMDRPLEEHFAYQTSKSSLRRRIGNCFQTQFDALLFVVPVFVLLGAQIVSSFTRHQLPMWIFWIAALAAPVWLLLRNDLQRAVERDAEKALAAASCANPKALLFRCSFEETRLIASFKSEPDKLRAKLSELAAKELRWAVSLHRFMSQLQKSSTSAIGNSKF